MTGSHYDNVVRAITAEMVAAGLSEAVAPTPAAQATSRILAGEPSAPVIRELLGQYLTSEATAKAEPAGTEPHHVRIAREAGKTTAVARSADDRIAAVVSSGNPWMTGNVTHQALVRGLDPARAAKLQREAGR